MSDRNRTELVRSTVEAVLPALLALLIGCGGSGGQGGVCSSERDCPAGAHCIDSRCVFSDAAGELGPDDGATDAGDADDDGDGDGTAEGSGDAVGDGDSGADDDDGAADDDDGDDDDGAACTDLDGDGHGPGCAAGPDCDDADPLHFADCADCDATHAPGCPCVAGDGFECYGGPAGTLGVGACAAGLRACAGGVLPDLCAGEVLPAAVETCGDGIDNDCDGRGDDEVFGPCADCDVTCRTDGPIEPDPADPGTSGLMTNPDGPGVVLGTEDVRAGYLWAANDPDGSVSKLDLVSGAEVARYRVGMWGDGCDSPSRTAVDGLGNAYVAARAHVGCAGRNQGSVTKMAGDARFCVDRNGNTVIDTSTGAGAMALGTDECVIWRVAVGGGGGTPRALAIDLGDEEHPEGHPWVGLWTEMMAYQLDPDTGAVLNTVPLGVNPYGFAVDSAGSIWAAGRNPLPGYIQRFSTVTLAADPPVGWCGIEYPYGITVDIRNRVWVGSYGPGVCRYDPATGAWMAVSIGCSPTRGVAADADGTIWASCYGGNTIWSFNMDDGSGLTVRAGTGSGPIGVGIDELGQVWTVNGGGNATRLNKTTGAVEHFPVGPAPYTYSDFTGYQRRLMIPRGMWSRDYQRCAVDPFDRWGDLSWDADVPAGATLTVSGASADTAAGLDSAPTVTLAAVPADVPPVDIEALFAAAGRPLLRFLRVTVTLVASPDRASPVFRSLDVRWHCYRMP